jgi:hypothetical protein
MYGEGAVDECVRSPWGTAAAATYSGIASTRFRAGHTVLWDALDDTIAAVAPLLG